MAELLSMAGIQSASDIYKPLRPSQILKSEVMVTNVVNVLSSEYINPFDSGLDKDYLVSLSSGVLLQDKEAVERILSLRKVGEESYNDFKRDRLSRKKIKFHHPIKRNELSLFSNTNKSIEIKTSTKTTVVEFNRNIVGTLLAYSARSEKMIDFEKALEYPLCSIPLSLTNLDGSPRLTTKSKLLEVITQKCELPLQHPREIQPPKDSVGAFVVDFMAIVRTMTEIPDTYEDLAWKLVKMLPHAKTTGGIKSFAVDNTSVLKWTLNCSEQAKNMAELLSMAGIQSASDIYKPLRPSQILKSEVMVTNVVNVLSSEYINPFDSGLGKDYLVSLSSGVP